MTDLEQKKAAKEFSIRWKDKALYPPHLLFNGITKIANKIVHINEDSFVTKINNLQYNNCYRQVYFTFEN